MSPRHLIFAATFALALPLGACEPDKKGADTAAPTSVEPTPPKTPTELADALRETLASGGEISGFMVTPEEEQRGCPERWEGTKAEMARRLLEGEAKLTARRVTQCRALGSWAKAKIVDVSGGAALETQTCTGNLKELRKIEVVFSLPDRNVRVTLTKPRKVAGGELKLADALKCHDDSALDRACDTIERLMQKDGAECRMMLRSSIKDDTRALNCIAQAKTQADIGRCGPKRPR